jgi:acyl dehydratase
MVLNPEAVAKRYPPTAEYEVCREHIREFATAIGDHNPAYHNVDAAQELGHPDIIAPPTYAFSVTMRATTLIMFDPDLGLEYGRVVHGEQSFTFHRPITAGDRLTVTAVIEDIGTKGRNEYLVSRSEIVTVEGEPVATTRELLISRGTAAS